MGKISRRATLKAGVAAGAAFVPTRFSIGKPGVSANSKLNIAMIGAGNIAGMAYGGCEGENIVALADVDSRMFPQWAVDGGARTFEDFRVMLDKMGDQIDAVCINTPDHTHFAATMHAMEAGKHVCTQKPLTHNIWEARTLKKAKDKYKLITNMAVQGHTFAGIRQMREWYEADVFGQVNEVHAWKSGPDWRPKSEGGYWGKPLSYPPEVDPVPASLNYDLWLGPVSTRPFNALYHDKRWRGFHAFGNGMFGDWCPHISDAAVWILDLYNPVSVEAEEIIGGNEWVVPDGNRVRWEFESRGSKDPCTMYWYNGSSAMRPSKPDSWSWSPDLPDAGTLFMGAKHDGFTDDRSNHPRLANKEAMKAFKQAGYPEEKYPRIEGGPFQEWIRAIKGEGPEPGANFDFASRFTETMLLGVLAARFGGRIDWDPKRMKITNRPELNAYVKEPVRKGWAYGEDLWK